VNLRNNEIQGEIQRFGVCDPCLRAIVSAVDADLDVRSRQTRKDKHTRCMLLNIPVHLCIHDVHFRDKRP